MKMRRPELCLQVPDGAQYPCKIGRYCYAIETPKIYFYNVTHSTLTIGNFVSIGPNVTIIVGGEHRNDWISTYPFSEIFEDIPKVECVQTKGNIEIGSDVWIGGGVTILSGVTIGHGAIIGAGSVVAKDVAPYSIVIGNPTRELRKRFNEEQIEKLLALAWWNLEDEKIKQIAPMLMANNIDAIKVM